MRVIAENLKFPEGPVAMPDGSVLVVEIAGEVLTRVDAKGAVSTAAKVPGGPSGAAITTQGKVLVANNGGLGWIAEGSRLRPGPRPGGTPRGGIDLVDPETGKVERLYDRCGDVPINAPNDIIADGKGGFWFTDFGKRRDRDMDLGTIYWAREDGSQIREVIAGMISPNGIGFSPDGKVLYVSETFTGRLWSWPVAGPGEVVKRGWPNAYGGTLVAGPGGYTRFDSLAVAESGAICIAAMEQAAIIEVAADGGWVKRHPVPDLSVSNICFGGRDMRTAFVTLSHGGLLIAMDWHEPGLRLPHQIG